MLTETTDLSCLMTHERLCEEIDNAHLMATGETEGRAIVRTEGVLGGDTRIQGTRIGVHHVVFLLLDGEYTIDRLVSVTYPDLTEGNVLSTLHYYAEHRTEIDAIREETERIPEGATSGPKDLSTDSREE